MNKLYSVHDHWTDINKKNDVDIESIDGVITGIKVNGEDYGGGETWNTLFDENVTTEVEPGGTVAVSELNANITADTIKVIFNNTEYICNRQVNDFFGAPFNDSTGEFDFSEYPFSITYNSEITTWLLVTQSSGTYTIKIEEPQSDGESDFSTANVIIINNANTTVDFTVPLALEEGEYDDNSPALCNASNGYIDEGDTYAFKVVLYKGTGALVLGSIDVSQVTLSGNIVSVFEDGLEYYVTGDCTITIS